MKKRKVPETFNPLRKPIKDPGNFSTKKRRITPTNKNG